MADPDFWQGAPRSLDIRNAASDNASVTLWAWSPQVRQRSFLAIVALIFVQTPAMDMRHYDTVPHGVRLGIEYKYFQANAVASLILHMKMWAIRTQHPSVLEGRMKSRYNFSQPRLVAPI